MTLKDIISSNPGISLAEAAQRLNAHNTALAMGMAPPGSGGESMPISAMPPNMAGLAGLGGIVGEGGALTKPHREL